MGWAVRRALGLGLLCCTCQSSPRSTTQQLPPAPAPAPTPPAGPAPQTFSVATFLNGQLEDCADVTVLAKPGEEAWTSGLIKQLTETGAVRLPQSCAAQFPNRTVLAICKGAASGEKITIETFSRYYDVSTVHDCEKQCLATGGSWTVNPDADAVRKEQHGQMRKRTVKLAE